MAEVLNECRLAAQDLDEQFVAAAGRAVLGSMRKDGLDPAEDVRVDGAAKTLLGFKVVDD